MSSPSSNQSQGAASPKLTTDTAATTQYVTLHSRVGKRYQAVIPPMISPAPTDLSHGKSNAFRDATKKDPRTQLYIPKTKYCPDRAEALGDELDKYLDLARSLRDGATFDTEEQVKELALNYLHRFNYQPIDAACCLYARHSLEVPQTVAAVQQTSTDPAAVWITTLYRILRQSRLTQQDVTKLQELSTKAKKMDRARLPEAEAGVVSRLLQRLSKWQKRCREVQNKVTNRVDLIRLLYEAEDLQFECEEREAIQRRVLSFDDAYKKLKSALERPSRKNHPRVKLVELEKLFMSTTEPLISFPDRAEIEATVTQARELQDTMTRMLAEDKVSLPAMREVMSRLDSVPVNFDKELEKFQQKMLSAQDWLAKARKCIPKKRPTRRVGGGEPKKVELDAIRALVDDAPCDDSAEVFEMQDLLDCADEWARKVKEAIEGTGEAPIEHLRELQEEADEMPVDMDECKYLGAEIGAREWCAEATEMLAKRKSLRQLERMGERAQQIRKQLHPKKQSRWKPQVERDIHASVDSARRWVNEVRDNVGSGVFDKLVAAASSVDIATLLPKLEAAGASNKQKKTMEAVEKVLAKADKLTVDVSSYVNPMTRLLDEAKRSQEQARETLAVLNGTQQGEGPLDFMTTRALQEKVEAFPFSFEEGEQLSAILESERGWAKRVRETLPPRQSRKKRKLADGVTMAFLESLLAESQQLHFDFPDEIGLLRKELDEMRAWEAKAVQVLETPLNESIQQVLATLQSFDLKVHAKVQQGKEKMLASDPTFQQLRAEEQEVLDTQVQDQSAATEEPAEDASVSVVPQLNAAASVFSRVESSVRESPEFLQVDTIVTHIRMETGCLQSVQSKEHRVRASAPPTSATPFQTNEGQIPVLQPLLSAVEQSLEALSSLELKSEKRASVETLVQLADDGDTALTDNITEGAVKQLSQWKQQIQQVLEESHLLSAVAPKSAVLETTVRLIDWLLSSRSIFYDEALPLNDLSDKGRELRNSLSEMKQEQALQVWVLQSLETMLWPLPYLEAQEHVVAAWKDRVSACIKQKSASLHEMRRLLAEGSHLLMEPEAFKQIVDEVKRAKVWLGKLKKRVKTLMNKKEARLTMNATKALVEDGEQLAVELPAFELLKEQYESAQDWESRVLSSGLESGQARIAQLVGLLNEYDGARFWVDLDHHREVLKSATERYCICRQPFDGFMIGCDHCDDWFHDNCIGMSKDKAEKVEHYTCPSCTILQGLSAVLTQERGNQATLWDDSTTEKNYEKQYSSAHRKIKREEKAIERNEELLQKGERQLSHLVTCIEQLEAHKGPAPIEPTPPTVADQAEGVPPPAAEDVEVRLAKLRNEYADAKAQIRDIHDSLRLSRDRLQQAHTTLHGLKRERECRDERLPLARKWVHATAVLLNNTSVLRRLNMAADSFMPKEYAEAIAEANSGSFPIEQGFPEVRTYVKLLRLTGWVCCVVGMLQERPSRRTLADAITYAASYNLLDVKTIAPLRSVVSRMDSWINKLHKCMFKTSNKAQRLARLKVLLNEYSKLPLTCHWVDAVENYVKKEDGNVAIDHRSGRTLSLQDAEQAAVAAVTAATAETAADAATAAQQKLPRKRRPYNRKEKTIAGPAKKKLKSKDEEGTEIKDELKDETTEEGGTESKQAEDAQLKTEAAPMTMVQDSEGKPVGNSSRGTEQKDETMAPTAASTVSA